jgi:DNA-binding MarR family transcriptional regulator
MNNTVLLVNAWATFEEEHSNAGIADFCRHFLREEQKKSTSKPFLGGMVPPGNKGTMARLIGRIAKLNTINIEAHLSEAGVKSLEEFQFLNTIHYIKGAKKTDVIYRNFVELSTGLLLLNKLKEQGWIEEEVDAHDKRTKRLSLTEDGLTVLKRCRTLMQRSHEVFFREMPDEDIETCTTLLTSLEAKRAMEYADKKSSKQNN